jgi:hypothetical protein
MIFCVWRGGVYPGSVAVRWHYIVDRVLTMLLCVVTWYFGVECAKGKVLYLV